MSSALKPLKWLYNEFGIASVYQTGCDAWFIILARSCRMFAFGANSLIIALFFSTLSFSDLQIGLFMTLTLLGDVVLSLSLTLVADKVGRRRILLLGALLMVTAGMVFAMFENFWILLFAAVVGVVSASGGDIGPFRAVEESTLSHLTTPKTRSDVLSWYVTFSSLGSAAGTEFSGRAVDYLRDTRGWVIKDAYHAIFWLYIAMGVVNMILFFSMSEKCEIAAKSSETEASETLLNERLHKSLEADESEDDDESGNGAEAAPSRKLKQSEKRSWLAQISSATRSVMYKLWLLLVVDSLADGMVSYALTFWYIDRKFELSKSSLGDITSVSYILASCSTIFAAPLAKRLGLVNTMVFTHVPSSAAVLFFPLPQSIALTTVLLYVRTGLNNMDQAPRTALIAAVVKPEERTAVMGITGMLRMLASTVGPSITGSLADSDKFWITFVAAGFLRLAYDFGLFTMFINMKLHTNEANNEPHDHRRSIDEEELADLEPIERATEGSQTHEDINATYSH